MQGCKTSIERVDSEERTAPEEATSKESDRKEDDDEKEDSGWRRTMRHHDPARGEKTMYRTKHSSDISNDDENNHEGRD